MGALMRKGMIKRGSQGSFSECLGLWVTQDGER